MATLPTASKDSLQGLIQGVQIPSLPAYDPKFTMEQYERVIEEFHRKLLDYLRRLLTPLTGPNILNELLQQTDLQGLIDAASGSHGPVLCQVFHDIPYVDGTSPSPTTAPDEKVYFYGSSWQSLDTLPQIGTCDGIDPTWVPMTNVVRFKFRVKADFTEDYTFSITADDNYRIYFNSILVDDAWGSGSAGGSNPFTVSLTATTIYPVVIEVANTGGGSTNAKIQWNSTSQTGGSDRLIPTSHITKF